MALPKLDTPTYELEQPSTGETIKYRPFLVKEQKTLILASESDDDKQIKNFSKEYDKWALENKHLPNLQTSTQIIERFKKQWEDRKNQQKSLDSRISVIEEKLDKLMNHLGVK